MKVKLLDHKSLDDISSGSAMEFYNDELYLLGHDAHQILVLTKKWKEVNRITLFESDDIRVPKDQQSDLKSMALIANEELTKILIVGSGSNEHLRNKAFLLNLNTGSLEEKDLTVFYNRILQEGVNELNIEGSAVVKDKIVFCNRANLTNRTNHFIVTDHDFWENQEQAELMVLPLLFEEKSQGVMGVSGLAYSDKNDWILFTAFTEDPAKVSEDGSIGQSYLGIIENGSRKIGRKKMKVSELINLTEEDEIFKGHKIESVGVSREVEGRIRLHMAASNDTGNTSLFKIRVKV